MACYGSKWKYVPPGNWSNMKIGDSIYLDVDKIVVSEVGGGNNEGLYSAVSAEVGRGGMTLNF